MNTDIRLRRTAKADIFFYLRLLVLHRSQSDAESRASSFAPVCPLLRRDRSSAPREPSWTRQRGLTRGARAVTLLGLSFITAVLCPYGNSASGASISNITAIVNAISASNSSFGTTTSKYNDAAIPEADLSASWRSDPIHDAQKQSELQIAVPDNFHILTVPPTDMVFIPSGKFLLGLPFGGLPVSTTELSSFYITIHEITAETWHNTQEWATNNGYIDLPRGTCGWTKDGTESAEPTHPIVNVSWYDAVKWCNAKSEQEGLSPIYYLDEIQTKPYRTGIPGKGKPIIQDLTANGYRLPTEAEWERAAKGGVDGALYSSGQKLDKLAMNYWDSGDIYDNGTTPACYYGMPSFSSGKQAYGKGENSYGLYDMSGNVYEWCWDWHEKPVAKGLLNNPTGPLTGEDKVIKGGSWKTKNPSLLLCAYRQKYSPKDRDNAIGFRCVRRL